MKYYLHFLVAIAFFGFTTSALQAQMAGLHGDDKEFRVGLHDGNQFRISFFNDGSYGSLGNSYEPGIYIGEWPINSGHNYLATGDIFIGSEVIDTSGTIIHMFSKNKGRKINRIIDDSYPDGSWRSFLPLPGFANSSGNKIAMVKGASQWLNSWPAFWPDIADPKNPYKIFSPDGWVDSWNGYFGKDVFNADEESYFVADDYQNDEFNFFPDSTDLNRRGLGIRMYARGFQWVTPAVEDVLFCLFDFENIGTYQHNKMVFGYAIENCMGEAGPAAQDLSDDCAAFSKDSNLVYMWDYDNIGGNSYSPVGYLGASFLESPGNPYDGIDNDNDGKDGSGPTISLALFQSRILNLDDQIVFIDYGTYKRRATTLRDTLLNLGKSSQDTLSISFNGLVDKYWAGGVIQEIGDNLFDDNLNGIIDENRGVEIQSGVFNYLYLGYKYIDYITGDGISNLLIDERRDDGIDNDCDWNVSTDDVGQDGLGPGNPNYPGPDLGEGDGIPTAGEPHFDKTDIDESDMLGLTSFCPYQWSSAVGNQLADDGWLWQYLTPGYFSSPIENANIDLLFGSGYFPLKPGQIQRFSMGIMCATDFSSLLKTKVNASQAYNGNYRLPQKPAVPSLTASSFKEQVTLTWNDTVEKDIDPILGQDFEGYKIYRSTNPNSFDSTSLIAQFDLDNEYSGYSSIPYHNKYFWLGNNTGLQHTFVDNNVVYGHDYYYTVTSYDHGSVALNVPPSECPIGISSDESGRIFMGKNAIVVRPVDPEAQKYPTFVKLISGMTNGIVNCEIVDTRLVRSNHTYRITFEDTTFGSGSLTTRTTNRFTLVDLTICDTVINRDLLTGQADSSYILHGFRLVFQNDGDGSLTLNPDSSEWSRTEIPNYAFAPISSNTGLGDYTSIQLPCGDYKIVFSNVGVDTSKYYRRATGVLPAIPVNFKITNTRTMEKVNFAFWERDTVYGDSTMGVNGSRKGIFSFNRRATSDIIIFLTKVDSPWVAGWTVRFDISAVITDSLAKERQLRSGDFITLKLTKPFLSDDVFEFTMPDIPVNVDENESTLPKYFSLSQNYPNPFNPVTIIQFSLPVKSNVHLVLINMLGQVVTEVIHGEYEAGNHKITLNASNLASGVYFFKIEASGFVDVKKLILLK